MRKKNKRLTDSFQGKECLICGYTESTVGHHIITKGRGGPDEEWNLVPLCHIHHREIHATSTARFAKKYIQFWQWLVDNDWKFEVYSGKWLNDNFNY